MTAVRAGGPADEVRWVADDQALGEVIAQLADQPLYALDTEFHRERTYFPKVALVQLAWPGSVVLVDPLRCDLGALGPVLEGDGLMVAHAAQQDLEVLARSCGAVPKRLFDTQLAAGFVGYATPSLTNLLSSELRVHLPKADRLTDWLARPLTADQRAYAAADVAHLLELRDRLVQQLDELGRLTWAEAECESLRSRPCGPADPDRAWHRIKDHRHLRGAQQGVAQAVAAWRERRAADHDIPVRFVLPDLAILGIAQRPPRSADELRSVRGLEDRHTKGPLARELLEAVVAGMALGREQILQPVVEDVDRHLRPAITLVSALVSQLSRDHRIDTALVATRADLVDFLNGSPGARLAVGWRHALVGDGVRRLVSGQAALAFDGKGNLVLVDRT